MKHEMKDHISEMIKLFPFVRELDSTRFYALANMASIIGLARLADLKEMWAALERNDYDDAANEILNRDWGGPFDGRAVELAKLMESRGYR